MVGDTLEKCSISVCKFEDVRPCLHLFLSNKRCPIRRVDTELLLWPPPFFRAKQKKRAFEATNSFSRSSTVICKNEFFSVKEVD